MACPRQRPIAADQPLPEAADRGTELPVQAAAEFFGLLQVPQHQDRGLDSGLPKFDAFSEGGHPKAAGTAIERSFSNGHGAMAIAIGLDHSHQGATGTQRALQLCCVVANGVAINLQPSPLLWLHRRDHLPRQPWQGLMLHQRRLRGTC